MVLLALVVLVVVREVVDDAGDVIGDTDGVTGAGDAVVSCDARVLVHATAEKHTSSEMATRGAPDLFRRPDLHRIGRA